MADGSVKVKMFNGCSMAVDFMQARKSIRLILMGRMTKK
jgi:hypothetical protein